MEKDFHGLPVLCEADLSNNQIIALGRDLVTKTRCKIENGVHEGTWETLKICLQDNPILCDAALPEITSAMEINHTRIFGVSHCPPLSEQPVTTKPSVFLGFIPDTSSIAPLSPITPPPTILNNPIHLPNIYTKPLDHSTTKVNNGSIENTRRLYEIPPVEPLFEPKNSSNQNVMLNFNASSIVGNDTITMNESSGIMQPLLIDPVKQEQQITKLASEIEELRTRLDQLSNQNQLLLTQQFNKTVLEQTIINLTSTKPPTEESSGTRKP